MLSASFGFKLPESKENVYHKSLLCWSAFNTKECLHMHRRLLTLAPVPKLGELAASLGPHGRLPWLSREQLPMCHTGVFLRLQCAEAYLGELFKIQIPKPCPQIVWVQLFWSGAWDSAFLPNYQRMWSLLMKGHSLSPKDKILYSLRLKKPWDQEAFPRLGGAL